jgi:hypothetical protein
VAGWIAGVARGSPKSGTEKRSDFVTAVLAHRLQSYESSGNGHTTKKQTDSKPPIRSSSAGLSHPPTPADMSAEVFGWCRQ